MAIDSAIKRRSCVGLALLFLRPSVAPNGNNLEYVAKRQHAVGLFVTLVRVPLAPEPARPVFGPARYQRPAEKFNVLPLSRYGLCDL